jgi:hypothetical protein
MKYQIMDTIRVTQGVLARNPKIAMKYDGVGTILVLEEMSIPLDQLPAEANALVLLPDGSEIKVRIASSEQVKGVTALFLRAYNGPSILKGHAISW